MGLTSLRSNNDDRFNPWDKIIRSKALRTRGPDSSF